MMWSILMLTIISVCASASSTPKLRSLSDVSIKDFNLDVKKNEVFIIFQKNCTACRQQIADIQCLSSLAQIILIGAFSSENELRLEYRRMGSNYPAFFINSDFEEYFKVQDKMTPQIIFNHKKEPLIVRGYTTCDKLVDLYKTRELR